MKRYSNLSIGLRLGITIGALLISMIAMATVGLSGLGSLQTETELIVNDRYAKIALLNRISAETNLQARGMRNQLLFQDPAQVKNESDRIAKSRETVAELYQQLDKLITLPEGKRLLAAVQDRRSAYLQLQAKFREHVLGGQQEQAKQLLLTELRPVQLAYFEATAALSKFQEDLMAKAAVEAKVTYSDARTVLLGTLFGAAALAVALGFILARSITRPVGQALAAAESLAAGDLTFRVQADTEDEVGRMMAALQRAFTQLNTLLHGVSASSGQIRTASEEVARGNLDLSSRTEQQASSLQETASSMEQITGNVRQSAHNATQASLLAKQASDSAERGQHTIGTVVATMQNIAESSAKVENIIGVIDGIAFQTNILALNAAVEAARAGEQGRGFAVVAAEVRTLAQRSADAAREIKGLITQSVDKVADGGHQVDEAQSAMADIQGAIAKASDMIGEISAASTEQLSGIEQINQAVAQLDSVTQQNAALVEEASAATQSMEEQSRQLAAAVAQFKIEGRATVGASPTAQPVSTASVLGKAKPAAAPSVKPTVAAAARKPTAAAPAPAPAARREQSEKVATTADDWNEF